MPTKKAAASRPSLARKTTPASEKARKEALAEGVSITVDGKEYTVRAGDLTALDAKALRRELGMSFVGLQAALRTDPDIDLIAGLMWLSRRLAGERMLSYNDVAADLGYDLEIDLKRVQADDEEEAGGDPEAPAGSS